MHGRNQDGYCEGKIGERKDQLIGEGKEVSGPRKSVRTCD